MQHPPPAGAPAVAHAAPSFVNQVWQVAASNAVAQGQTYVFLTDGTLVIASSTGTPSLGSWTQADSALTLVEDGRPSDGRILELGAGVFRIRLQNPGEPVDITFEPAPHPPLLQ